MAQSTTESIIKDIESLYEVALKGVHGAVSRALESSDLDLSTVRELESIFDSSGPYGKLFPGLDTYYLQMKYLRHNFNFVVRHLSQIDHAEGCLVYITYMYTPLLFVVIMFPQEPVSVRLGTVRKAKGSGAKRRIVEVEEGMMYIPILETLNVLLNNEAIASEVSKHVCAFCVD